MTGRAEVTARSGLRLREEPVDGTVVTVLGSGSTVYVLERVDGGRWLRVRQGSHEGFASATYLRLIPRPDAQPASSLRLFAGSQMIGKPVRVDEEFVPHLERLNERARQSAIQVFVTSSFRKPNDALRGTVVPPARRSNHLVGHAIDMNLKSESGFFNSKRLRRSALGDLPGEIRDLITWVRKDDLLRWGGDFRKEDPVHIDDALNVRKPDRWEEKFRAV